MPVERATHAQVVLHFGDDVRERQALERDHLANDAADIRRTVDHRFVAVDDIDDRAKLALGGAVVDQADTPDLDVLAENHSGQPGAARRGRVVSQTVGNAGDGVAWRRSGWVGAQRGLTTGDSFSS